MLEVFFLPSGSFCSILAVHSSVVLQHESELTSHKTVIGELEKKLQQAEELYANKDSAAEDLLKELKDREAALTKANTHVDQVCALISLYPLDDSFTVHSYIYPRRLNDMTALR